MTCGKRQTRYLHELFAWRQLEYSRSRARFNRQNTTSTISSDKHGTSTLRIGRVFGGFALSKKSAGVKSLSGTAKCTWSASLGCFALRLRLAFFLGCLWGLASGFSLRALTLASSCFSSSSSSSADREAFEPANAPVRTVLMQVRTVEGHNNRRLERFYLNMPKSQVVRAPEMST